MMRYTPNASEDFLDVLESLLSFFFNTTGNQAAVLVYTDLHSDIIVM